MIYSLFGSRHKAAQSNCGHPGWSQEGGLQQKSSFLPLLAPAPGFLGSLTHTDGMTESNLRLPVSHMAQTDCIHKGANDG